MILKSLFFFVLFLAHNFALENGLARKPPMGWMSWTAFFCEIDCIKHPNGCINEDLYKSIADRFVADGYADAGYKTIHIDDCWSEHNRTSDGKLIANRTRFPSGIDGLAKHIHDKGVKLGIYSDVGTGTCEGYPGSWGYEEIDAKTFADWGVDYLKYDGCNLNYTKFDVGYPKMQQALGKAGRPIVYSTEWAIIYYPKDKWNLVNYTRISKVSNVNRVFWDVSRSWTSILSIIDFIAANQDTFIPLNGPGFWIDPDMIVVGNPELTLNQARAQMSIWSIWSAPLLMSNDLRNLTIGTKEILLNKNVIAMDQDPLGVMGRMVSNHSNIMTFVKKMTPIVDGSYSYAIAFMNRGNYTKVASFKLKDYGLINPSGYQITNLWSGKDKGVYKPSQKYRSIVRPTGVHMIKATVLS